MQGAWRLPGRIGLLAAAAAAPPSRARNAARPHTSAPRPPLHTLLPHCAAGCRGPTFLTSGCTRMTPASAGELTPSSAAADSAAAAAASFTPARGAGASAGRAPGGCWVGAAAAAVARGSGDRGGRNCQAAWGHHHVGSCRRGAIPLTPLLGSSHHGGPALSALGAGRREGLSLEQLGGHGVPRWVVAAWFCEPRSEPVPPEVPQRVEMAALCDISSCFPLLPARRNCGAHSLLVLIADGSTPRWQCEEARRGSAHRLAVMCHHAGHSWPAPGTCVLTCIHCPYLNRFRCLRVRAPHNLLCLLTTTLGDQQGTRAGRGQFAFTTVPTELDDHGAQLDSVAAAGGAGWGWAESALSFQSFRVSRGAASPRLGPRL